MNSLIQHSLIVMVPLILSNVLHMIVVKKSWFGFLNIPISESLFGSNKTWRGIVFLCICNACLLFVFSTAFQLNINDSFLLGGILGLTYLVFELPNSFMKRKLGIAPGGKHTKYKLFFSWIDKSDSTIGLSLVYCLLGYVNWKDAVLLYIIFCLVHIAMSKLLVFLKIKKSF